MAGIWKGRGFWVWEKREGRLRKEGGKRLLGDYIGTVFCIINVHLPCAPLKFLLHQKAPFLSNACHAGYHNLFFQHGNWPWWNHLLICKAQCAKKVVSDSLGLVDFAIRLVNSVFNLPDGHVMFLRNSNNRRTVKSVMLVKKYLGLVEMTSGLVNASFRLPEWQSVKMIFLAPWRLHPRRMELANILSEWLRRPKKKTLGS